MRGSLNTAPVMTMPVRQAGTYYRGEWRHWARSCGTWIGDGFKPIAVATLMPLLLVIAWHWATASTWVAPQLLPSPREVLAAFTELAASGELLSSLTCSLNRVLFGFLAGASVGLCLGWAMGVSRRLEQLLYPMVSAIAQVPALGFIPLAMMLLGIGEALKVVIVAKAVFVPVLIHAMRGVNCVPTGYLELADVNEHRTASKLIRVILPASLRHVVTGLRLGLSQAWLALVTVELLASSEGIGYVMIRGRQLNQVDVVLATAVVIGAIGFLLDISVRRLEHIMPSSGGETKQVFRLGQVAQFSPLGLIVPAAILAFWSWAAREHWVDPRFVPSPGQCLETLDRLTREGELTRDIVFSLRRMTLGLLWGAIAGIATGVLLGRAKWLGSLVMPTFNALRQVTLIAWIPLLTLWVGQGEEAKQTFIALAVFIPVTLSAFEGSRSVSSAHLEVSAVFDARPMAKLWAVTLPSAVPHLWAGLELALIYAWLATIAAEYFFRVAPGIGNAMVDGREHFQMDLVLCAVAIIALLGFILNRLALTMRGRLLRWSR